MRSASSVAKHLLSEVVAGGTCTGCGACTALDPSGRSHMIRTPNGPVPNFPGDVELPELALSACPGRGVHYPSLYRDFRGSLPANWLVGDFREVRTGHSGDPSVRMLGASGGVITQTLLHLLSTRRIDAAILVRQGIPQPLEASVVLASTPEEIRACAQSVYIPVSTLDILSRIDPTKRYAITCLPDQSASLRRLQADGFGPARAVRYVLGPFTGTALTPQAIRSFLRGARVPDSDTVTSLNWRAGEWPGHLEIRTSSGRVLRSKKIYYNFLIPFFVTQASLQSMDFANEFADLSVGDAWSPRFESQGRGFAVFLTRSEAMESIIAEMVAGGSLIATTEARSMASEMHGHMIDFKKRGGWLRNRFRRILGLAAPDFGIRPHPVGFSRFSTEVVISLIFLISRSSFGRFAIEHLPERWMGPLFNQLRLAWKGFSKPTKRRGLANLQMIVTRRSP